VPAVPEGGSPHGIGIVTILVGSASLVRVVLLAVKLDDEPVFRVIAVQVTPCAIGLCERNLLLRRREAVRALHITVMPVLKDRVCAANCRRDNFAELTPPAQLPPCLHGSREMPFVSDSLAEGPGDPADDVIEFGSRFHQVEDGVLLRGVRRNSWRRTPDPPVTRSDMNGHAPYRPHTPLRRDRDVDLRPLPVGEADDLGGALVTETCAPAGVKNGRPQLHVPCLRPGKGGINASVQGAPSARIDLGDDSCGGHARREGLPPRYHAALLSCLTQQATRDFPGHTSSMEPGTDSLAAEAPIWP